MKVIRVIAQRRDGLKRESEREDEQRERESEQKMRR